MSYSSIIIWTLIQFLGFIFLFFSTEISPLESEQRRKRILPKIIFTYTMRIVRQIETFSQLTEK